MSASPAKRFDRVSWSARPRTIDRAAEVATSAATSTPKLARSSTTRMRHPTAAATTSRRMAGARAGPRRPGRTSTTRTSTTLKAPYARENSTRKRRYGSTSGASPGRQRPKERHAPGQRGDGEREREAAERGAPADDPDDDDRGDESHERRDAPPEEIDQRGLHAGTASRDVGSRPTLPPPCIARWYDKTRGTTNRAGSGPAPPGGPTRRPGRRPRGLRKPPGGGSVGRHWTSARRRACRREAAPWTSSTRSARGSTWSSSRTS